MDILSYTEFEQLKVAGKHLTKFEKNDMAAVVYIATLLRGLQVFGRVGCRVR